MTGTISKGDRRRAHLARAHEKQASLCYWCNKPTLLHRDPGYYRNESKTKLGARSATIDHLYSKIHPLRLSTKQRLVMACNSCNLRRSAVEVITLRLKGVLEPRIYRPDEKIPSRLERALFSRAQMAEFIGLAKGGELKSNTASSRYRKIS